MAKHAQKVMAKQAAATYGLPVETTAEDALLAEVNRANGIVLWLEDIIRNLSPDQLVWGVAEAKRMEELDDVEELAGGDMRDRKMYELVMKAGANTWLTLYQQERKALLDVASTVVKLGLDERRVRLAERQGNQLSAIIRGLLVEMELSHRLPEVGAALAKAIDRVVGTRREVDGVVVDNVPTGSVVERLPGR